MNIIEAIMSACIGAAVTLGILFPVATQAACNQSDLSGIWMIHGVSGDTYLGDLSETDRCKIKVNSSGSIVGSASSCTGSDYSGAFKVNIKSGYLQTTSTCKVTGKIRVCGDVCGNAIIEHGTLSKDANVISLVGYDAGDRGVVISWTAVKR